MVTGPAQRAVAVRLLLATYDTGDTFDQSLAKGFIELWGLPSKIAVDSAMIGRRRRDDDPVPVRRRSGCGAAGSRAARPRRWQRCR